jgi:hypothetical protein
MQSTTSKRAGIFIGVFMIFVLIVGAFAPLLRQSAATQAPLVDPTEAPTPTFPPPVDTTLISFDQSYLHPSGLFTVAQPDGWAPGQPISEENRAATTLINSAVFSVIEVSVEQSIPPLTTVDELDARFTHDYLAQSWSRYGDWTETQRRHDGDRLVLDFTLTLQNATYIARQAAWTDGDWIYTVRVVTPSNASGELIYVLDGMINSLHAYKEFLGTPFTWIAYYDPQASHIIRYPQNWVLSDTAPGRPSSITGPEGQAIRVESQAGVRVADEAAAGEWVQSARSGATILSTAPIERGEASGFSVAYAYTTVDGEAQSGLAILLNGTDEALHVANLHFPGANVDLNAERDAMTGAQASAEATVEATAEGTAEPQPTSATASPNAQLAVMMDTFRILPPINLAPNPNATPTPLPTVVPAVTTQEATVEATSEATAAPAEATDAPADATAEATAAS